MDSKTKAKGRANSALRLGLQQAREDLIRAGKRHEAEACTRALLRSERLESHGA
jgi:hypothetical protein